LEMRASEWTKSRKKEVYDPGWGNWRPFLWDTDAAGYSLTCE